MANEVAKPGFVFVCLACGKRSRDKYGDDPIDAGWDESCMLHAEELAESRLVLPEGGGRVRQVLSVDGKQTSEEL
jgi:hypothetical protein